MSDGTSPPPGPRDTVFVTGAAGLVGRACVSELVRAGHAVRVLEHRAPVAPAEREGVEVFRGGLESVETLGAAIPGCDAIVHAAALMTGDETEMHEVNVEGTRRVCQLAEEHGVQRVVFLSSATVYGLGSFLDADESTPLDPGNAYGRSKVEAESLASRLLGEHLTVLRPPALYETGRCPIVELAILIASQPELPLVDGGSTPIDLLHADDLARAIALALGSRGPGEVFNVTGGHPIPFRELVTTVADTLGTSPQWHEVEDVSTVHPVLQEIVAAPRTLSMAKLTRRLGFEPRVDWRRALPRAVTAASSL